MILGEPEVSCVSYLCLVELLIAVLVEIRVCSAAPVIVARAESQPKLDGLVSG